MVTSQQEEALKRLDPYETVKVHEDGDLTVRSGGRLYVVTTDGEVFAHYTPEEALKRILGQQSSNPNPIEEAEPEKATEILSQDGNQRGIMVLWSDKKLGYCIGDEKGEGVCDTLELKGGEPLYYMFQAFYSNLGHKIKPIEV